MAKFAIPRIVCGSICAAALAAGVLAVPAGLAAQQPYHVIAKWKIGGESRWDYLRVDPATHLLYVSNADKMVAVDLSTGKIVGTVAGLDGCHGVAFDAEGKYGYISDGSGVVVFDRKTYEKVKTIDVGGGADGILYEPVTKTVWSLNRAASGGTATAIDTATQKLVATVATPRRPEASAVDGKGNLYSNLGGEIIRIDARTKRITAHWDTGCEDASGLAADGERNRIFQACRGQKMYVVDGNTGKVLGTAEIGEGPDGAGWSAKYHLAFASTRDGYLSVVDANAAGYPTIEKLATMEGARTMYYDESTDRVYTVSAERNPDAPMQMGPPPGPPQGHGQEQRPGQGGPEQHRPSPYLNNTLTVVVIGR